MKFNTFYLIFFLLLVSSCATRNLVYFSDLPDAAVDTRKVENAIDPLIQPMDLLSITVSTLNPESNLLFNSGVLSSVGGASGAAMTMNNEGYRVDKQGEVNFPVLGKVELGGLTIDEAISKMGKLLESEVKNPIVNIKLINFKITVVGEVSNPSTFPVMTERINIVEAIGLAGDLTPFGKRENVLLIRENEGERTTVRLDLNKRDIFSSPYYYLQQNDIIYVEPVRTKGVQASMGRQNLTLALSIISILSLVAFRFF